MKIIHLSILLVFFFTFSGYVYSQNLKENEMVIIQGEKFILHQVRTGETVYSISRDFKIDSSQLLKHNPKISDGLSIGDILKIPYNENVDLSQIPTFKKGDPTGFINHTIDTRNETAYSISKQHGITVEEIYAYNPSVRRLKKGITLKIPQWEYTSKPESVQIEQPQAPVTAQNAKKDVLIEHTVVSGETLYSLGKRYQVSESEILFYNPDAKNLKAGSKLYLPQKTSEKPLLEPSSKVDVQNKFIKHTIVSGETIYGITKKYKVSEEELKSLNPELITSFRTGTVILIPITENLAVPVQPNNESAIPVENIEMNSEVLPGKVPAGCMPGARIADHRIVNVALFLPLFADNNEQLNKEFIAQKVDTLEEIELVEEIDTDTVIEEENPVQIFKQFYGNSENFLQFYEGVLIAVDSMQKAGMRIKLNVYDTKDNPESIRKTINNEAFLQTDLIIGPVYENLQKEIAQIAYSNHIPLISPFTPKSTIINNNPLFYQINPTREYLAEATAEMIAAEYSNTNFIVVRTSPYEGTPEGQMVELIRRKLANSANSDSGRFVVYDFRKERSAGLPNILLPDRENVVFIPSSDEGEISVAISNINNFASEFPITLIGASNYQQRYPSIEVAHFHNLKLKYINPYWIDYYDNSTINYIEKFIANFGTEPNSYGVQGFDASWYFLNALYYYGKDFEDCLPYMNVKLLQGNYYFKRVSQWGGYMNQGVSVISYNRNFEVESKGVIGKPKQF